MQINYEKSDLSSKPPQRFKTINNDYLKRFTLPKPQHKTRFDYEQNENVENQSKHSNHNFSQQDKSVVQSSFDRPSLGKEVPVLNNERIKNDGVLEPVVEEKSELKKADSSQNPFTASYIKRSSEHPEERLKKIMPQPNQCVRAKLESI